MAYKVAGVSVLLAVSPPVAPPITPLAESMTCGELATHCSPGVDARCMQTLSGVLATHPEICAPPLSWQAATGVFNHWTDLNPKLMKMPGWNCVAKFYEDAFPCQK